MSQSQGDCHRQPAVPAVEAKLASGLRSLENSYVLPHTAAVARSNDGGGLRHERVLRVRAAGCVRRLAAAVVDGALVLGIASVVSVFALFALRVPLPHAKEIGPDLLIAGLLDRSPLAIGAVGLCSGIAALYHVYLGGIVGQTIGKRMVGIRVIGPHGGPPGPLGGTARLLAAAVSILPAGLGWLWCLFDREHRALHDHLAGTYVILDDRAP